MGCCKCKVYKAKPSSFFCLRARPKKKKKKGSVGRPNKNKLI